MSRIMTTRLGRIAAGVHSSLRCIPHLGNRPVSQPVLTIVAKFPVVRSGRLPMISLTEFGLAGDSSAAMSIGSGGCRLPSGSTIALSWPIGQEQFDLRRYTTTHEINRCCSDERTREQLRKEADRWSDVRYVQVWSY